ncbi:hypothetical protein BDW75DRAFT_239396 [Aspergillus navahoensis]
MSHGSIRRPKDDSQCHAYQDEHHNQSVSANTGAMHVYQYLEQAMIRRPQFNIWRISMDNLRASNLAAKSLDIQTREVFNTMISTVLFPATYAAFYKRVDQDITAFVRDDPRTQCPAMEWLVRCYATWYFAKQHNDDDQLSQSRYIYGVLLGYLRIALDDPRKRTADITLALAILLGVYELFDGTSPDAWLTHIQGVKEIMRLRGGQRHVCGFSRTIFLSCRAFFITEAFINQRDCFLAEPEWASANAKGFGREDRAGRGSKRLSIIDKGYREIVCTPGLVAQTRALVDSEFKVSNSDISTPKTPSRENLRAQIQRSRAVVRRLSRRLISTVRLDVTPEPTMPCETGSEPLVDSRYITTIARYNFQALRATEELLARLEAMIECSDPQDLQHRRVTISPTIRRQDAAEHVSDGIVEYSALPE